MGTFRFLLCLVAMFFYLNIPCFAQNIQAQEDQQAAQITIQKAEKGDAEAQFNLGHMYYTGEGGVKRDNKKATEWFRKAAEQGITEAQYNLGLMYYKARGYTDAMTWYRKAAEQGLPAAQFNLCVMYDRGEGVPQDYKEAFNWCLKSAEQGITYAQFNLGVMYANGEGVPQDYVQAHKWLNLSAVQGGKRAASYRDHFAKKMTPDQIAEAQRLAQEWRPTLPEQENPSIKSKNSGGYRKLGPNEKIVLDDGTVLTGVDQSRHTAQKVDRMKYPAPAIVNLQKTCEQRKDIPLKFMQAYCSCYIDLIQKDIPWSDFLLLDSAINTKGINGLDAQEKEIMGKGLEAASYCSQKNVKD